MCGRSRYLELLKHSLFYESEMIFLIFNNNKQIVFIIIKFYVSGQILKLFWPPNLPDYIYRYIYKFFPCHYINSVNEVKNKKHKLKLTCV